MKKIFGLCLAVSYLPLFLCVNTLLITLWIFDTIDNLSIISKLIIANMSLIIMFCSGIVLFAGKAYQIVFIIIYKYMQYGFNKVVGREVL